MKRFICAIAVSLTFVGVSQANGLIRDVVSLPVRVARNVLGVNQHCNVQQVVVQKQVVQVQKVVAVKQVVVVEKVRVAQIVTPVVQVVDVQAYAVPYAYSYPVVPQSNTQNLERSVERLSEAVQQLQQIQLQQLKKQ